MILFPLLLGLLAPVAEARLLPTTDGAPHVWLVSGPHPRDRWEKPVLDEAALRPSEGDAADGKPWVADNVNPSIGIDFRALLRSEAEAVVYAYAEFEHPTPQDALLLFGSDDGAQVFVDGKKLFETRAYRGVKKDEDKVPFRLNAGGTRILFKVDQYRLGWGLTARVVGRNGLPLPGLRTVVRARPGSADWRGALNRPGALDLPLARRFDEQVGRAERWLRAFPKEKSDGLPEAIAEARAVDGRTGDLDLLNARRATTLLTVEARLAVARKPLRDAYSRPTPLLPKVDPKSEAFVRPMPGGRYFQVGGKPWTPVGYNHNPDWTELAKADPLSPEHDPKAADKWMAKLAANGVNLLRMMVETPPSGNLEESPGQFRPEHVMWLDTVVLAARKHGIRLWLTPWDTFWMNLRADASPYWRMNGGPVSMERKQGWYTDPKIAAFQRNRMDYLIARYGNLGTVFSWEIMNEAELWWDPTPAQLKAWTGPMRDHVRAESLRRWGRAPMLSISLATPETTGDLAEIQYRLPGFDFATNHLYVGRTRATKAGEEVGAGQDFAKGVQHALGEIRDRRPVLDGESGPIDKWVADARSDNLLHKEMSWAHLMAGGAGPGTRWPYRGPHHLTDGMLRNLLGIRKFSDEVPWAKLTGDRKALAVPGAVGLVGPGATIARVRSRGGQALALTGRHRVFDIARGAWTGPAASGRVVLPKGVEDAAVFVER